MLDQQDGDALHVAHAADLAFQRVDLVVVEAGGGFVEQQQLGFGGEGAGKLNALADGEGQAGGDAVGEVAEVHEVDQFQRLGARGGFLAADVGQAQRVGDEAGTRAAVAADHDVFQHSHAVEQGDVLEGAANADHRDAVCRGTARTDWPSNSISPALGW